jgi:hypothetical protein
LIYDGRFQHVPDIKVCRLIRFSLIRAGFGQKPNQTAHFSPFSLAQKLTLKFGPKSNGTPLCFYAALSLRPRAGEPTEFSTR